MLTLLVYFCPSVLFVHSTREITFYANTYIYSLFCDKNCDKIAEVKIYIPLSAIHQCRFTKCYNKVEMDLIKIMLITIMSISPSLVIYAYMSLK